MEEHVKLIETLIDRAGKYGKTSFELEKLKALDKTTDVLSSLLPLYIAAIIMAACLLFTGLGLAFWLGELFGRIFFGFFAVAGGYFLAGILYYSLMRRWIKRIVCNYMIKQALK